MMTLELFLALCAFALGTVLTPGPNNMMLMASGANFGLRRSLPHMVGVAVGFPIMILTAGLGAMQLFELYPILPQIMTVLAVLYMLWLAWKIANAAAPGEAKSSGKPLTFVQAAGFQWVNPKAWAMGLGAITLYAPDHSFGAVLWVAGTYVMMAVISTSTWTVAGVQIRRILTTATRLRLFNWSMAGLLVASLIAAIWLK